MVLIYINFLNLRLTHCIIFIPIFPVDLYIVKLLIGFNSSKQFRIKFWFGKRAIDLHFLLHLDSQARVEVLTESSQFLISKIFYQLFSYISSVEYLLTAAPATGLHELAPAWSELGTAQPQFCILSQMLRKKNLSNWIVKSYLITKWEGCPEWWGQFNLEQYYAAKMKLHTEILISTILILSGLAILSCGLCESEYQHYCSETDECQSKYRTCNGQCTSGKRYCPRFKVTFFSVNNNVSTKQYNLNDYFLDWWFYWRWQRFLFGYWRTLWRWI